jgi:hypothetical protein
MVLDDDGSGAANPAGRLDAANPALVQAST